MFVDERIAGMPRQWSKLAGVGRECWVGRDLRKNDGRAVWLVGGADRRNEEHTRTDGMELKMSGRPILF